MTFLIQQTLIYAVPLMIVALAGVFAERSGIINLALEGIMVFGAFIGVWFVRILQTSDAILSLKQSGNWVALQGVELLTMLVAAAFGALFSLLLSFASINLRADQTIGGTALNLMAPALVLFFIRIIANQNTLQMLTGDAASWFMIKKSTLGIDKNTDLLANYLKAIDESYEYVNAHMDESAEYLEGKIGVKADDFKLQWKVQGFSTGFSEEAAQHLESIQKWAHDHGKYDSDYNVRDFIDTRAAKIAFPDKTTVKNTKK